MKDLFDPILAWLTSLSESASGVLDFVESIDPALRTVVAGVAALFEMFVVTGLFVPGDTVILVAASAVSGSGEALLLGLTIAVGSQLGEMASYALGAWKPMIALTSPRAIQLCQSATCVCALPFGSSVRNS